MSFSTSTELLWNAPTAVTLCSEKQWKNAGSAVTIENNAVYLQTNAASWVKIDWNAHFSGNALVLGDAWERTYGDARWKPIGEPAFHPWYFAVRDGGTLFFRGVKTAPAALCCWFVTTGQISLLLDVRCGCLDTDFANRRVRLAELVSSEASASVPADIFSQMQEFCRLLCPSPAATLPASPIYGGDDWYTNYGRNSFEKVLDHAKIIAECAEGLSNRPYQTVDAGWQLCHNWVLNEEYIGGPFRYCNDNFGSMKDMADAIRALNVHPGIWYRPMETVENLPDDAILRKDRLIKYMDPSHPAAKKRMTDDILQFRAWGYDMIKHDFAGVDTFGRYGFLMTERVAEGDWAFYDRSRTSAEIVLDYYRYTAEAAGDVVINACNTLSHLSAGLFPLYRIGDDTSGHDFARTVQMGVNTLAYRGAQHRAFYAVDADCVGITHEIAWERNQEWLRLLRYSGTSLLVSIEKEMYTAEVREAVTEAFRDASQAHETAYPLDWDKLAPCRWQTWNGVQEFNWCVR